MDLKNLKLAKDLPMLQSCKHALFYSKHLCGPATDMCLRHIVNYFKEITDGHPSFGICIATCCQHLLDIDNIAHAEFFRSCGFSKEEVACMAWASSWASTKTISNSVEITTNNKAEDCVTERKGSYKSHVDDEKELTRSERRKFGKRCKLLFDFARAEYLRTNGFNVDLVRYTTESVDNTLLLAFMQHR